MTPAYLTDYEDNKMKKDNLATLHHYDTNQLLSNLHLNISNLLNILENQGFLKNICKIMDIIRFCH